jgi:hypothetical protein
MIIGISGYARSGKDTFAKCLQKLLTHYNKKSNVYAFAHILKKDIDAFLLKKFNISAFTEKEDEKKLIRPMLVAYGQAKRIQDEDYWIKQLNLKNCKNNLTIITDVRYLNEAKWIIDSGGYLLNLKRISENGNIIQPANQEEQKTIPEVEKISNATLTWGTIKDEKLLIQTIESFIFSCETFNERILNGN